MMQLNFNNVFLLSLILFSTVALSYFLTPLIIKLYQKKGWDKPHENLIQKVKNTHRQTVPRGGGIVIFLTILVAGLIFIPWKIELWAILAGALIIAVVGVLDDIIDLNPFCRLFLNILVAILVIMAGIRIEYVTNPFGEGVIDLDQSTALMSFLTIFYIVALMNITNWSKGVDGQLPGVVVIAAIFIGILSLRLTQTIELSTMLSFMTAGSFLGFLFWNFYPQKIMPGYGGGALAGYLLAVLSMMAGAKIATLFMVLALPIADATFTIARRLIAGKSIFLGDRGHLHHKLLDKLGWGRRRIALFYWLVTLMMGVLALILPTWGKIITFLLVCILVFWFLIAIKIKSLTKTRLF